MAKRTRTIQARKRYTRLGESRVRRGVEQGTYIGGRDARVQVAVDSDE
jgi:hypothetical protein